LIEKIFLFLFPFTYTILCEITLLHCTPTLYLGVFFPTLSDLGNYNFKKKKCFYSPCGGVLVPLGGDSSVPDPVHSTPTITPTTPHPPAPPPSPFSKMIWTCLVAIQYFSAHPSYYPVVVKSHHASHQSTFVRGTAA
jgi:hypothetical protein